MPLSLIVGASGAVGHYLRPRLLAAGHDIIALSRVERVSDESCLRWQLGDLCAQMPSLPPIDAIFSLGPLDAFARWFAQSPLADAPRVIAFGSMSIDSKRTSSDAAERAVAERLRSAEDELIGAANRRGSAWTIFRPTLIYGAGIDRSLTPIARFGARWRVFPHILGARGLRQPVHADDLAAACTTAFANPLTHAKTYALGGGERLAFAAMLERVRASLSVATLPVPLPLVAARAIAALVRSPYHAAFERASINLVAEHALAVADFGWAPRAFRPDADAWRTRA